MSKVKQKKIYTLKTLLKNTTSLLSAAKKLLSSEEEASYAFVLLQTASEEMGRIWALWLYFTEHTSVKEPPKNHHLDKHIYFIRFMAFQLVGHRSYFEIMSDILGFKITKLSAEKIETLKKIQKFRERNLYVGINSDTNHVITHPLENNTAEKQKLFRELHDLLIVYKRGMLESVVSQYEHKKITF
jgi:AbiV family abortive infection protein